MCVRRRRFLYSLKLVEGEALLLVVDVGVAGAGVRAVGRPPALRVARHLVWPQDGAHRLEVLLEAQLGVQALGGVVLRTDHHKGQVAPFLHLKATRFTESSQRYGIAKL